MIEFTQDPNIRFLSRKFGELVDDFSKEKLKEIVNYLYSDGRINSNGSLEINQTMEKKFKSETEILEIIETVLKKRQPDIINNTKNKTIFMNLHKNLKEEELKRSIKQ